MTSTTRLPTDGFSCRPFNLGDGMILIAALAFWFSVMPGYFVTIPQASADARDTLLRFAGLLPWSSEHPKALGGMTLHLAVHNILHGFRFLFGYLLVAVLVIGFRRPREPFRELVRLPGIGGCLVLAILPWIYLVIWWLSGERFPHWIYLIFACALIHILLGRPPLRPRSGWIECLSRAVAWYWVIAMIVWAVDGGYHEGMF
jgi:hypothetical protein